MLGRLVVCLALLGCSQHHLATSGDGATTPDGSIEATPDAALDATPDLTVNTQPPSCEDFAVTLPLGDNITPRAVLNLHPADNGFLLTVHARDWDGQAMLNTLYVGLDGRVNSVFDGRARTQITPTEDGRFLAVTMENSVLEIRTLSERGEWTDEVTQLRAPTGLLVDAALIKDQLRLLYFSGSQHHLGGVTVSQGGLFSFGSFVEDTTLIECHNCNLATLGEEHAFVYGGSRHNAYLSDGEQTYLPAYLVSGYFDAHTNRSYATGAGTDNFNTVWQSIFRLSAASDPTQAIESPFSVGEVDEDVRYGFATWFDSGTRSYALTQQFAYPLEDPSLAIPISFDFELQPQNTVDEWTISAATYHAELGGIVVGQLFGSQVELRCAPFSD